MGGSSSRLLWHSGGDGMPRGPSWKAEIAAWRAGQRDCTVDLAPPGWQLGMGPEFRRRLDQLLQEVPVHDPQTGRPRTTLARLALWRQANGLLWRPGFGQKVFARLCKQ